MYYRLSEKQEKELLANPETGMCYQVVEAALTGTDICAKFIVLNAELAIEYNDAAPLYVQEIFREGIGIIKEKAMPFRWEITRILEHDPELKTTPAVSENRMEYPDGGEIFVRRSIYENDKRIDLANKRLIPGSFTTTLNDALRYRTNSEDPLIQRAMDHGVRGKWGYHVQPKRTDILQRGKCDPKTGAKEVFFRDGTAIGTFFKRETY